MKDDELITTLRGRNGFGWTEDAADRIEALAKELDLSNELGKALEEDARQLRSNLAKAIDALRLVTDACDEGQMVSLGTGGMTIDAQIRRSVYNKVPAWPIEEARVVLEELEKKE